MAAFSFGSLIDRAKIFFTDTAETVSQMFAGESKKKGVEVRSVIELAEGGDVEGNGEIDSGDTIIFKYFIANRTDNEYSFSRLLTHIPRNNVNFIHDVQGTVSLSDENDTITIPNLLLPPQGELVISFKARIDYSSETVDISTEPELIAQDGNSLAKTQKQEIKAKPWKGSKLPGMIQVKEK